MNINKRLLQYVKTMRVYVVIVGLLSLLTALTIVFQSQYIARIINQIFLNKQALPQVLTAMFVLLAILVARALLLLGGEAVTNFVSTTVKTDLRQRLFKHIFKLGPQYTKGERSGEMVNTTTDGVEALDAYFIQYFPQVCATMIIPTVILIAVFSIDVLSGVVLLVTWPILPVFMILIGKQGKAMTEKRWYLLSHLSAHFLDVLQGITTLKLFGRSKPQQETIKRISDRYGDTTMQVLRVVFLSSLVMEMGATISNAIIAVEIGLRLVYGYIPFEQAFFVLLLTPEFYQPLRTLGSQFHASMESAAGATRIFNVLEIPAEEKGSASQARTHLQPQTLQVNNLHYTYPSLEVENTEVLKGVSFTAHSGQTLAIVGPSGSGKSTIANLLLRFMEPTEGEILVDGTPIQNFTAHDWRTMVTWQPQRPYVFNMSVADNIRMGRADASMDDVIRAAQLAHLHDFVLTLPKGYETIIGERGTRLSGGQIQRLSLARAFLKDAPILILDEATSTLDTESEAQILQTLNQALHNKIVIIIAHRLNTIRGVDNILVLRSGRIVESGTHHALLETSETYQELTRAYQEEGTLA